MQKMLFLIFLGFVLPLTAMDRDAVYECEGMHYKKNNFGDIFPLWQDVSHDQLAQKLSSLVASLKSKEKGTHY